MKKSYSNKTKSINELVDLYQLNMKTFTNDDNKNLEFEIRFGNKDLKIDQQIFENVFKVLYRYGFKIQESKYSLKTEIKNNYQSSLTYNNIRIEINDLESIQNLCNTNELPDLKNVLFVNKSHYNKDLNKPYYINNYGLRVSIQNETILNENVEEVRQLIEDWNNENKGKTFRYIYRKTLIHDDFPNIKIDLSTVKSNYNNPQYKFKDSNVMNNKPNYEIEIEFIDNIKDFDKLQMNLKKVIKYILIGIQKTSFPTSFYDISKTLTNYYDIIDENNENGQFINRDLKSTNFIGPSSKTLQKINIIKDDTFDNISIQDDFAVTDKADGDRKLLFINKIGFVYFITSNLDIQFTGIFIKNKNLFETIIDGEHITMNKFNENVNYYYAFDIYFQNNKDLRKNPFYITDTDDDKIIKNTRYVKLNNIINYLNQNEVLNYVSTKGQLKIYYKDFLFSDTNNSIFNCCSKMFRKINKKEYMYNTDGLIFTSKLLGVGQELPGDTIKNRKYTWKHSFKWKPPEYNTIDFLIEVEKDNKNELNLKSKMINGVLTNYYEIYLKVGFSKFQHVNKLINLLDMDYKNKQFYNRSNNNYKPKLFYPSDPSDENAHICHIPLKIDQNDKYVMITEENDVIQDDTVVEFRYDLNSYDKFMAWKPIRVRYDKTSEYKSSRSNYGNDYNVANNNWESIHDPVIPEMLTTPNMININNVMTEFEDVYYNGIKTKSKTKSLRDFHNLFVKKLIIDYASSMQPKTTMLDLAVGKAGDFPKWIDSKIYAILGIDLSKDNIYNPVNGACSRFFRYYKNDKKKTPISMFIPGDTSKLIHNGDFAKQNSSIFNSHLMIEKNNQNIDDNDNDNEENNQNLSYDIYKSLMGISKKEDQKYEFLKEYNNIFSDKFDVCSMQFALHYMFENKEKLHSFLCNISNHTKNGKYFIGTCYDGKKIFNLLKDINEGDKIEKYAETNKIWHCVKRYSDTEDKFMNNDENCLGYKIGIYQETINKEFDEYLVNFDYFINLMEQYGFILDDTIILKGNTIKPCDNFEVLYNMMMKEKYINSYKDAHKMIENEKFISFLNNYFIFRKINDVDTELLYKFYTKPNESELINLTISNAKKTKQKIILE